MFEKLVSVQCYSTVVEQTLKEDTTKSMHKLPFLFNLRKSSTKRPDRNFLKRARP